jgi:hypothetical protein
MANDQASLSLCLQLLECFLEWKKLRFIFEAECELAAPWEYGQIPVACTMYNENKRRETQIGSHNK